MTPIICRGAGTNTVGACVSTHGGIILNFSKMNKILEINPENMTAKVQPGVVVGDLQQAVEKVGLFYPPDPSNLKVSTIGGSIAQIQQVQDVSNMVQLKIISLTCLL